jgi:hypothetical protein
MSRELINALRAFRRDLDRLLAALDRIERRERRRKC